MLNSKGTSMSSSQVYREKFEELGKIEGSFSQRYKLLIDQIKDPLIIKKLSEVHEDEKRHILIAKSFLEITKSWI